MAAITHATARKGTGGGFLAGMFIGLLIGLATALGIALFLNKTPIPFASRAKPADEDKPPAKPSALAGLPQGGTAAKPAVQPAKTPDKPRFDFYKILVGGEEPLSDRELRDKLAATKSARADTSPGARDVYFVQVGAFQNPAEADNQKARLAILGLESNVEPTNLPDKGTFYRVRLGPYANIEDLNRVRQTLAQNGIDASLVKVKESATRKN